MPRYRSFGQLDDPFAEDGEAAFTGLDQNTEPVLLQPGMLQLAENVRIDQGTVSSRPGLEKLIEFSTENEGLGLLKFLDPDNVDEQMLLITRTHIKNVDGQILANIHDPYTGDTPVLGTQAFEQVILFGQGKRPKTWSGQTGEQAEEFSVIPADASVDFVCPAADFGNYISNRLAVPLTSDSPSTIAFSDILEPNQFDIKDTYFCNKGTSDKTLGVAPFMENTAIVFNKNSIHQINNTHVLGDNSTNFELTRQYGIAGPRAWAQNGSYTYFVSNEGNIQVLVPSSDPGKGLGIAISKVTMDQEPLSKPITPLINRVNLAAIDKCVTHYHRNKVYFALPIDNSPEPNVLVCYDSLNSRFVSVDTFGHNNFKIKDIKSLNDELFILSNLGLYKFNSTQASDNFTGTLMHDIASIVRTRNFLLQDRGIKKFVGGTVSYKSNNGGNIVIQTHTIDPDSSTVNKHIVVTESDSAVSRFDIRQRGYVANIDVFFAGAKTEIKSIYIEGIQSSKIVGTFD